ncbi:MAG: cyclic nucleotide-binding domain-containing protein [Nitrospinales bacterium]
MEQRANQLIGEGQTEPAVKQIYALVQALAKKKDFAKAETWRKKLIEVDPNALTEILSSAEIIDLEKSNTINYNHQRIWENLYISLTQDEGNALYLKLEEREFPAGKVLVKQGTINNTLFFVDSGNLKNIFNQGEKEVFINDIGQGYTVGQDTFFGNTICTSTVITSSPVKAMLLSRSNLMEIQKSMPKVTKIIKDHCTKLENEINKASQQDIPLERRQYDRFDLTGELTVQIFDKNIKQIMPTLEGVIKNISIGGALFSIQCSTKNVGRSLLGRKTTLTLTNEIAPLIKLNGYILGTKFDRQSSYAINLKFFKPYTEDIIKNIVAKCQPSS